MKRVAMMIQMFNRTYKIPSINKSKNKIKMMIIFHRKLLIIEPKISKTRKRCARYATEFLKTLLSLPTIMKLLIKYLLVNKNHLY